MPVFLQGASGLDTFACDCCGGVYPRISMHEHHKIKRADGGRDTRENIALLDAHCHHALHQIESALKTERKRLLVPDLLKKLFPENAKARETCLYLAMTAALAQDKENPSNKPASSSPDFSAFDTEDLVHLTPPKVTPHIRDLVNAVAKEMRRPNGRSIGVANYLRLLVEADLKKRGLKLDKRTR